MIRSYTLIAIIFFLPYNILIGQTSLDTAIQRIMKDNQVVGLSVAVVKKDKIIFSSAYGYKDLENKTVLSSSDLFRIASISKSFSATSIMQLVEQKKINVDQDVSELIGFKVRNPKYPDKIITLRLLLSHLSSINDSQGYFSLDAINPDKNPNWAKCYTDYEPGSKWQY